MSPLALAPRRVGHVTLARGDGYAVVGYFPRATRFDPRRGHLLYSGDSHWTRGPVYQTLTNRLREALGRHVRERYGAEVQIVLSRALRAIDSSVSDTRVLASNGNLPSKGDARDEGQSGSREGNSLPRHIHLPLRE